MTPKFSAIVACSVPGTYIWTSSELHLTTSSRLALVWYFYVQTATAVLVRCNNTRNSTYHRTIFGSDSGLSATAMVYWTHRVMFLCNLIDETTIFGGSPTPCFGGDRLWNSSQGVGKSRMIHTSNIMWYSLYLVQTRWYRYQVHVRVLYRTCMAIYFFSANILRARAVHAT